jgi:hypothetical protein
MEKICNTCDTLKPLSDFRNRNQCKSCENKLRYKRNKEKRLLDPKFDKLWKEYDVKRKRKKEKEDEMSYFVQLIRQCVRKSIKRKGYTKKSKTYEILGGDWGVVKEHFELLFQPGMSWDNYGDWEIDHIIPLSKATNQDEVIKLCNYLNLQPLWKLDNRLKGDKLI